jgi:hypothetical protein
MINKLYKVKNINFLQISVRAIYNPFESDLQKAQKQMVKAEKTKEQMIQADEIMKNDRSAGTSLISEDFIYGRQMNKYPKLNKVVKKKIDNEIAK